MSSPPARRVPSPSRASLLVAACLFLSGAASLGLEVVWSRLLRLVFGSTTLAVATILVAYMLGLGLGGLLGGRFASRLRNGVRAYGWLEVGIGIYALGVPWVLGLYPAIDRELLGSLSFWPAAGVRFLLALVVLILPTLVMGATLPLLVAALVRGGGGARALASRTGLLYGANTLGAVAGVLLATFVLFPALGVHATNAVSAGLDLTVGLLAVLLLAPRVDALADAEEEREAAASAESASPTPQVTPASPSSPAQPRWNPVLLSYGVVGFTALAYEVSWTRALSMILGSSVYAFATMLAGFLAGIALGSLLARRRFDRLRDPAGAYALGVLLLGLLALGTVLSFGRLPDAFLALVERYGAGGGTMVRAGLGLSFVAMLGPTLVLGALFPLVVRAAASADRPAARTVGDVYFVNTLGSASGAFAAGFVLIPALGLRGTQAGLVAVDLALGGLLLLRARASSARMQVPLALLAAAGAILVLVRPPAWDVRALSEGVFYRPEARLRFGLDTIPMADRPDDELLYYEEGVNTTVSVHRLGGELADSRLNLRVNGKTDASLGDMSTQVLSGHLPILFGGPAERALVIGYASGITTGALTLYDLERVDVVEIEPAILDASRYFEDVNHRPLDQVDRVHLVLDDGRTYLATSGETYDVIVSEPSNPWITGCSNLFTREFFELARASLRPGGRLLQWIQLYGMRPESIRSVLAALHEVFPHAYGFLAERTSGDLLLIATDEPLTREELPSWEELSPAVQLDLQRASCFSTVDLWSLMLLSSEETLRLAAEAPAVNTDDDMYVELHAPWDLNLEPEANQELLQSIAHGVLPVADAAPEPLSGELVGELALSYWLKRDAPRLAIELVEEARARGGTAHAIAFQAEYLVRQDPANAERALTQLDQAVALAGGAFLPRWLRALHRYDLGDFAGAVADLDACEAAQPNDPNALRLRMSALARLERFDEADAAARALLASPLAEVEPEVLLEAANVAAGAGDPDNAAEALGRYLDLFPYSPREWEWLARLQAERGEDEAASLAEANVPRARRNQLHVVHRSARWQEWRGEPAEALRVLRLLRRIAPDYLEGLTDLERLEAEHPELRESGEPGSPTGGQ